MSGLFTIPVGGLKVGRHCFDFEIGKGFFDQFEESEIKAAKLNAVVEAERTSSHIDITVRITGEVNIACDRCLGVFPYPVRCEDRLLVKFGRVNDESDPDIIIIPPDESVLDLKKYFYEYILLALPIQRMHPNDKDGNSTCDPEMLKKLQKYIVDEENNKDPRWNELRNLIIN